MTITTARIAEVIVTLNQITRQLDDNDTVEFDIDDRLTIIENQVDTLSNEVEEAVAFSEETSS